jgi:DNA-directed RNA polymerase specialized sigma24 family protein
MTELRRNRFATTQWSIVRAAGHHSSSAARAAMEDLCQIYWLPVYAFIRRKGHSPTNAEDLTQAFFLHLLESEFVKSADQERGRFRSFLLKSVSNFLAADHRTKTAEKRGGDRILLSLDFESGEHQYHQQDSDSISADQLFERRWAMTLLQNVATLLRSEYEQRNHGTMFELLEPHINLDAARIPYADLCPTLSMSEDAIKQAVRRMKLRYREILRSEIASTVDSLDEVDDELRQLMRILSNGN